jgi:hypothetical protein
MILPTPSIYPMSMAKYGLNPFGEPMYRLVFAPSVKKLVGGKFKDGYTGYRARPAYAHIGPHWVIEKWLSGYDYTAMSEQKYEERFRDPETQLFSTGPYPTRGIYFYCETLSCNPADANLDKLIMWLEQAKKNDPSANQRAVLADMEKKEAYEASQRYDQCKEALPSFGVRAASFNGHVKPTKSAPIAKTANELGLPVRQGPSAFTRL